MNVSGYKTTNRIQFQLEITCDITGEFHKYQVKSSAITTKIKKCYKRATEEQITSHCHKAGNALQLM